VTTYTTRPSRGQSYTDWRGEWESVLTNRKPFHSASAMSGGDRDGFGRLPYDERDRYCDDDPEYVVFSYATPIAWYGPKNGWTIPDVKYSVTTTRHQSIVRMAVREAVSA
jgi:hypothetical protein